MRSCLLLASLVLACPSLAAVDEALWALLRGGGQMVFMRHAITTPGVGDPAGFRLEDCAPQRDLTDACREAARRVGATFRSRGIPIGRVLSSPWCRGGDTLMTVRDNDVAAASIGVDVWRNRFIAFVLAAAGCGRAGAVSFTATLYVAPGFAFDPNWVVAMMIIVIIGGIGTLEGPILGVIIYFALREALTVVFGLSAGWYLIGLGLVAIAAILFEPDGLWPLVRGHLGGDWLSVRRDPPGPLRLTEAAPVAEATSARGLGATPGDS